MESALDAGVAFCSPSASPAPLSPVGIVSRESFFVQESRLESLRAERKERA